MSSPVPGTGHWRNRATWHRKAGRGVSASSRIFPHRYESEGDKGPRFRRSIRRREERAWLKEWKQHEH